MLKGKQSVNTNNGALLVSVTKDQNREHWLMKYPTSAWFYYKKVGDKDENRLSSHEVSLFSQHDDFPSNLSQSGQLLAVPLKAGSYEITHWTLYVPNGIGYRYINSKNLISHRFNINSGEVLYLGNLHLSAIYGQNIIGISIETGAKFKIKDKSKRDYLLAKEKYPQLSIMTFKKEIAYSTTH